MGSLFCSRCGKKNITTEREELNLAPIDPKFIFPRHTCSDCYSQFYFYENVVEYVNIMMKMVGAKKT